MKKTSIISIIISVAAFSILLGAYTYFRSGTPRTSPAPQGTQSVKQPTNKPVKEKPINRPVKARPINKSVKEKSTNKPVKEKPKSLSLKTAVVFFEGDDKQKKYLAQIVEAIKPTEVITLKKGAPIKLPQGKYDYIILTGGHGDTSNGAPTQLNGMPIEEFRKALAASKLTTKVLVLDFCGSASTLPAFASILKKGSLAIVSLGESQGIAYGIIAAGQGTPIQDTFTLLLKALDEKGSKYNAISIYKHSENGGTLYTRKYKNIDEALKSAKPLGIEDKKEELLAMKMYLKANGITIKERSKAKLIELFKKKLKDVKW